MRRFTLLLTFTLLCGLTLAQASELQPRLTWDKYIFADGVNPEARDLTRLIVKYYDEDMVRQQDGVLQSARSADLTASQTFLANHPEVALDLYMKRTNEVEYQTRTARVEEKSGIDLVDLFSFQVFKLEQPAADPHALLAEILEAPEVELAYYESIPFDAVCTDLGSATPDYQSWQTYQDAAPLGVDLDYAHVLFGEDVTDGAGEYSTYSGIFERGMQTTHEDVTLATVGTDGTPDADNNHGTAVMGVMGACDDNGVGMLGFMADQRMVFFQRNSTAYGSTAEVYDEANSQLIAGEVTNSSWGYRADPMPPGQSCPSNPGQNGRVPCEYDPGVKASIQAGVADGIHYFLAAHNGCTDLDDAVFGNIFDWSTDTGSIIVGACESAVSGDGHDAISWTSYGSRLTNFCWGENIYTTGYGTLFVGTGPDEWYDNGFGGTSGATPIVAGVGGVLNNIWRSENSGANIAPTTLRDWLQINGTPNTNPSIPIGIMPNLFGIMAPDLALYQPGGWDAEIVPNNTLGDHAIPANLSPTPTPTYMGWSFWNRSHFSVADPAVTRIYRDDVFLAYTSDVINPWTFTFVNGWETQVRGGNHYWKVKTDPLDDLVEGDETNNDVIEMYVWDGIELERDVAQTWTRGPKRDPEGVFYYAKDGFYNGGGGFSGLWEVFGVIPETDGNYNMFIHSDTPNSLDGFTTHEDYSGQTTLVDFVGCNQNQGDVGSAAWVSIMNMEDTDDDYTVEGDASSITDGCFFGSLPTTQTLAITDDIAAGEILNVYEMLLVAGDEVWFDVDRINGNADMVVLIYGPDHTYFARDNADWMFNDFGPGEGESGLFTATADGYHGVVVCKHHRGEAGESTAYNFYWGPPHGDLVHYARTGWDAALVARNDGTGSVGVIPPILNEGLSVVDNGYLNIGDGYFAPGSNSAFYLDGPLMYTSGDFVVNLPPLDESLLVNQSIGFVKGGRHEVGARIDVNEEEPEEMPDGESNNHYYTQYCWAPHLLYNQTPIVRSPAPNYRNDENPSSLYQPNSNQDGYLFEEDFWTGVATIPHDVGDTYNLEGYDYHSTDPVNAFLGGYDIAFPAAGSIAFTMMNGNAMTGERDFGIRNNYMWPDTPSLDSYTVEGCQSIQDLSGSYPHGPFTIDAGHIIHTFDIHLGAGTEYDILLENESTADIGIAIFDAGSTYEIMTTGLVYLDSNGAGLGESGSVIPNTTGYCGVAVFKHGTADLPVDATYRLRIGIVYPPAAITDLTITPVDLAGGNRTMEINFTPIDEDIWGWPLEVDHYTLFAVQDNPYDFTSPYVENLNPVLYNDGNGLLYFHSIGWYDSAFFYLVAVDENGFLLTPPPGCPWEKLEDIPGYSSDSQLLSTPPVGMDTLPSDR